MGPAGDIREEIMVVDPPPCRPWVISHRQAALPYHFTTRPPNIRGVNSVDFASPTMALGGTAWMDAFYGFIPGSMGETSALACAIGAAVLIATGIGSWRTMLGVTIGTAAMVLVLNSIGSDTNPAFAMPVWWHMVVVG